MQDVRFSDRPARVDADRAAGADDPASARRPLAAGHDGAGPAPVSQATTPAGPAPAAGRRCQHTPVCPEADAPDRDAARVVRTHPDQGWSLLCNGVILFEDTGEILPSGRIIEPRRVPPKITSTGRSRSPRPPAPRRAPTTVPVVTAGV